MPTYLFEAMDATGQEIRDEIEAPNEDKAQETIRQMGYFVTKISVKKARKSGEAAKSGKKRGLAIGGVSSKLLTTFTRQLSIHSHHDDVDKFLSMPVEPYLQN